MADSLPPNVAFDSAAVARLVARERVRAMESLAAAIAHDIRSAVLGVSSAAQLLRYAVPSDPVAEKSLGRILQESERLSALHEALSEYATEVPPRFVALDPDELWQTVLSGMRGALEASSVTATHLPPSPRAKCLIDEEQLTRAFERLVHHALSRSAAGTELVVSSAIEDDGGWHATIAAVSRSGASVHPGAGEVDRPTFLIALAHRTLVAHGGTVTDLSAPGQFRLELRLPFSRPTE